MVTRELTEPVKRGEIEHCYGIYISTNDNVWDSKDVLLLGLYDQFSIEKFLTGTEETVYFNPLLPLLKINMPCGESVVYRSLEEIPDKSTPCPCGNPKHWLIKYKE